MQGLYGFVCGIVIASQLMLGGPCGASSLFEVDIERDALRTPAEADLSITLTREAKINGGRRFQISIYVAETLVRKQVIKAIGAEPTVVRLMFPEFPERTDARCRVELFLGEHFAEAKETTIGLWPAQETCVSRLGEKVVWVFDTSGRLQEMFAERGIHVEDAVFQAVRDFHEPDVVFVGEQLGGVEMKFFLDALLILKDRPLVVLLRQKRTLLPGFEVPENDNRAEKVSCDFGAKVLAGLNEVDLLRLVDDEKHVIIKTAYDVTRHVSSFVTEVTDDKLHEYSYLATVEEEGQITLFCQLPIADGDDPRCQTLFDNILTLTEQMLEIHEENDSLVNRRQS